MIRACFASLVLLTVSSPAVSQDASGQTAFNPVIHPPPPTGRSGARMRLASGSADEGMRESLAYPRRMKRAERLSALARSGDCLTAFRIALREHDEPMAANLATACQLPAREVRSIRRMALR